MDRIFWQQIFNALRRLLQTSNLALVVASQSQLMEGGKL
jgi:hypothetical protein